MKFIDNLKWAVFVSRRFSRVDRRGKSAVTSFLASLGICMGVMTLIVVMSVMNGFQMTYIDAIMEVSSYHIRVSDAPDFSGSEKYIKSVTPFYEAQTLIVSEKNYQSASLVRCVPKNVMEIDSGFKKELLVRQGKFDLSEPNSIVIGSELSRTLGVHIGDKINLLALSGGNDVKLIDSDRIFTVKGIFWTGDNDVNTVYSFISIEDGKKYLGENAQLFYGIKLFNENDDAIVISKLTAAHGKSANNGKSAAHTEFSAESWKEYNRSFFGALKVEKNILMLLVVLIFIVVGINIFNGIRRIVYERKAEISVFASLGAKKKWIHGIFIAQGFSIGFLGAIPGLFFGILISKNMKQVFAIISKVAYFFQYITTAIFNRTALPYVAENPMFAVYGRFPARIIPSEIFVIVMFGILSALVASYAASKSILKMKVAEVLRDE